MSKLSHYNGDIERFAEKARSAKSTISDFPKEEQQVARHMLQEVISLSEEDNFSRCIINAHLIFFEVVIRGHRVYISTKTRWATHISSFAASDEKRMVSVIENAMNMVGLHIEEHKEIYTMGLEVSILIKEGKP